MNTKTKQENSLNEDNYSAKAHYRGDVAKSYLANRTNSLKWRKEQKIMNELISNLPADSCILDLPVGTGRLLPFYSLNKFSVYGMDISKDMIAESKELHKDMENIKEFIEANAEDIPLPDNSVDFVICLRLLNLVPFPVLQNILTEFNRVSKFGVIVQVRLTEVLPVTSLIKKIFLDPRTNINKIVSAIISSFKNVFMDDIDKSLPSETENFYLHESNEFYKVLNKEGLKIRQAIEVDKGMDFKQRVYKPLVIFDCTK
jgi:ubiquinone/menaquinone biosynthesis C-methylase UbiE